MADGTRFKVSEDRLRGNETEIQQLQQLAVATRESLTNLIQKQEQQGNLLAELKRSTKISQEKIERMLAKADRRMDMLAEMIGNQRQPLVADPPAIVSGVVEDERTILIKIKFEIYPISIEVLNRVFSACGVLESVETFSPGDDFHSKVCFQDYHSAIRALEYNGRCIYDRCCELELFQASEIGDRSREFRVAPIEETGMDEHGTQTPDFKVFDEVQSCQEEVETTLVANTDQIDAPPAVVNHVIDASLISEVGFIQDFDTQSKSSGKVFFETLDFSSGSIGIESIERWANLGLNSSSCLRTFSDHKVFVERADRKVLPMAESDGEISKYTGQSLIAVADCNWVHPVIFDPGGGGCEFRVAGFGRILAGIFPNPSGDDVVQDYDSTHFDKRLTEFTRDTQRLKVMPFVFDPGGKYCCLESIELTMPFDQGLAADSVKAHGILNWIMIFDPGGTIDQYVLLVKHLHFCWCC